MLDGEVPADEVFAFGAGLFLVPATAESLTAGAADTGFASIRRTLKAHALGEGVNQWVPTTIAPTNTTDGDNAKRILVTLTNFRVIIGYMSAVKRRIEVPLSSIHSVTRGRNSALHWVDVDTKLWWKFRIASENEVRINSLARELTVRMPRRLRDVFAYAAGSSSATTLDPGWGIYCPEAELHRMIGSQSAFHGKFCVTSLATADFPTYPPEIITPSQCCTARMMDVARFRQNGRVPAVSWVDGRSTGAVLARCSQPLIGVQRKNAADESVLLFLHSPEVCDAPPTASATAGTTPAAATTPTTAQPTAQRFADPTAMSFTASIATVAAPPSLLDDAANDSFFKMPVVQSTNASIAPASPAPSVLSPPAAAGGQQAASTRTLHVVDCRSRSAAAANFAGGGGTEQTGSYPFKAVSHFLSMANIHGVEKSFRELKAVCAASQQHCRAWGDTRDSHSSFLEKLSETHWPNMVMKILFAANRVADCLDAGDAVLVHCTDGWDRTAQVVSTSMLLKDGYYRTIAGFCLLVESEWIRMGHRFQDRCDIAGTSSQHSSAAKESASDREVAKGAVQFFKSKLKSAKGRDSGSSDDDDFSCDEAEDGSIVVQPHTHHSHHRPAAPEDVVDGKNIKPVASPVFLQWLDAVYQLLRMYPDAFEFTPAFLAEVGEAAYSGQFGTFLGNTHRSRHQRMRWPGTTKTSASVASVTPSLWTHIARRVHDERVSLRCPKAAPSTLTHSDRFLNPFFNPQLYRVHDDHAHTEGWLVQQHIAQFGFPSHVSAALDPHHQSHGGGEKASSLLGRPWQRLRPSFQSKRYTLWASWFLKHDFDTPIDLTTSVRFDVGMFATGGTGLEAIEHPAVGAHLTCLTLLAEVLRQLHDAPTLGTLSQDLDTTGVVLESFPTAIVDPAEFNARNVLSTLVTAATAGEGESLPETESLVASPQFIPGAEGVEGGFLTTPGGAMDGSLLVTSPMVGGGSLHHHQPSSTLAPSGATDSVGFFIPREDASVCYLCEAAFSIFNRRHTCRMCSRSVCSNCGNFFVVLQRGDITLNDEKHLAGSKLRVCRNCHTKYRTSKPLSTTVSAAT